MSMRSWLLDRSDRITKAGIIRSEGATILVLLLLGILGCGDRMAGAVSTGNTARISGVVKDSTGRAVDAEVSLVRMSGTGAVVVAEMPTEADGSFEFGALPAGSYRVVVDEDSSRGAVVEGIELAQAQNKNLGTIVVNVYIVNNINITINNYVIQNIYLNTPNNPLAPSGGQIVLRASPDSGQVIYVVAKDAQGREQLVRFRLDYAEGRPVFTQLDPTGMPADIDTIPAVPVCTPVASTPATSHFALDARTVALWRFDEGCGDTAYDASRNRLHGRLDSGATWVAGEYGRALRFAPSHGIVDVAYRDKLDLDAFTIDARVQLSNRNGNPLVLKIGDDGNVNFEFAITNEGKLSGYLEAEDGSDYVLTGLTALPVGEWVDIAFSYDGAVARLYLDGVEEAESTFGARPSIGPGRVWIGHHINSADNIFNGSIDEIRISDTARYQASTRPSVADTTALLAYWNFDESAGSVLTDRSGNGHHGSIQGANWVSGYRGGALRFGEGSKVVVPYSTGIDPAEYSLEAWVKTPVGTTFQFLISMEPEADMPFQYSYRLGILGEQSTWGHPSGRACLDYRNHWAWDVQFAGCGITDVSNGQWHHVVATYSSLDTVSTIYVDGIKESVTKLPDIKRSTRTEPLILGASNVEGGKYYLLGQLDEVRIWKGVLPAWRVEELRLLGIR